MSRLLTAFTVLLAPAVLVLAAAAVAIRLPYAGAKNGMPADAALTLRQQEDGTLLLSWPESAPADEYLVGVYTWSEDPAAETECLFSRVCAVPECALPAGLPEDQAVTVYVSTQRSYRVFGEGRIRDGDNPVAVLCYLNRPEISDLRWEADPDRDTVTVRWRGWQGDTYYLYRVLADGGRELIRKPERVQAELSFGPEGDFPVPEREESYTFVLDAAREQPGLTFFGRSSPAFTVTREDLLGRALELTCTEEGNNAYTLRWNETKGERWLVQLWNGAAGDWETLKEYAASDERVYETGHSFKPCADYTFRVAAVGGQTLPGSEFAAAPAQAAVRTTASPLYATVWPMKDLDAWATAEKTGKAGTAKAAAAYCVLEENGGLFRVRTETGEGWIDSDYCMINLPDYIGDLCNYDITNSYSSIYLVHEYGIPEVSGAVISGYEDILLADGSFVVPLLYPTAQKLISAAEAARADGLRLKIYDSYRPNRATRAIYDLTNAVLDLPVPEETFDRVTPGEYRNARSAPQTAGAAETGERPTYRAVMTNGVYTLGNFLASRGSMHNLGIAMDLMLERPDTGEELTAQTRMHDLSWYSAMSRNTENAKLLDGYMKAAGFGSIGSEWWHFQDNEIRAALNLPTLWPGVSAEGWKRDDGGWRYRRADGGFLAETTAAIGGVEYRFGADGYAVE